VFFLMPCRGESSGWAQRSNLPGGKVGRRLPLAPKTRPYFFPDGVPAVSLKSPHRSDQAASHRRHFPDDLLGRFVGRFLCQKETLALYYKSFKLLTLQVRHQSKLQPALFLHRI
jgi:hypothetical protein